MCHKEANSREHVPPRCFFPEQKDLPPNLDYRKNLLTVPSCSDHNLAKSKEDEYLLLVILSTAGNLVGQRHFSTKAIRAIKKRRSLLNLITKNAMPATWSGQQTMAFSVDKERFDRSISCLARAIYFHHFNTKWVDDIRVDSPSLLAVGGKIAQQTNQLIQYLGAASGQLFENETRHGSYLDIFYYQIYRDEQFRQLVVRMVFYESVIVMASSWSE
jgi:hypothetical protein